MWTIFLPISLTHTHIHYTYLSTAWLRFYSRWWWRGHMFEEKKQLKMSVCVLHHYIYAMITKKNSTLNSTGIIKCSQNTEWRKIFSRSWEINWDGNEVDVKRLCTSCVEWLNKEKALLLIFISWFCCFFFFASCQA